MERNPFLVSLDNDNDEAGVRAGLSAVPTELLRGLIQ